MSTPTGLKNPGAAVRGVGAAGLVVEGVVLLMALLPLAKLGDGDTTSTGPARAGWLCAALALVCFLLCGLLKHNWAWTAGLVVQVVLLGGGFLHWSLTALGILFGAAWLYALYVRRSVYANKPD